jgi:hypothetical protein
MSERALQSATFDFLRVALPADACAFAVPNGDGRMTTMPGALSGVPDICIVYRGRSIFIELKTAKGAVRLNQKFVHDRLTLAGALVAVCRSVEAVEELLSQIIPLRARLAA